MRQVAPPSLRSNVSLSQLPAPEEERRGTLFTLPQLSICPYGLAPLSPSANLILSSHPRHPNWPSPCDATCRHTLEGMGHEKASDEGAQG